MTCDNEGAPRRSPSPDLAAVGRRTARCAVGAMLALGALGACDPASMPVAGERAQAEEIARRLVAARDPVIDPGPVARCAAIHATPEQADALVAASGSGDRAAAQAALDVMLRKTSTQECLAGAGQPDFL